MKPSLLVLILLLTACTGDGFDEATIPADQQATEFAFTRMAKHGEIEPVVEADQPLTDWQFYVAEYSASTAPASESVTNYRLTDRSGIYYTVSSATTPANIMGQLKVSQMGYATGRIITVDRDLVAGKIDVVLELTGWRSRELK
jgi:hypothetical protein